MKESLGPGGKVDWRGKGKLLGFLVQEPSKAGRTPNSGGVNEYARKGAGH